MFRTLKWSLIAVVFAGLMGWTSVAQAADAKGKIAVTVVDKDGKAVADASIRVSKPRPAAPEAAVPQADGGKKERPAAIAEGKTDADGKVTLEVPAGEYSVVAMKRGDGGGFGMAKATVEAGKEVAVSITLGDAPKGGKKGGKKQ